MSESGWNSPNRWDRQRTAWTHLELCWGCMCACACGYVNPLLFLEVPVSGIFRCKIVSSIVLWANSAVHYANMWKSIFAQCAIEKTSLRKDVKNIFGQRVPRSAKSLENHLDTDGSENVQSEMFICRGEYGTLWWGRAAHNSTLSGDFLKPVLHSFCVYSFVSDYVNLARKIQITTHASSKKINNFLFVSPRRNIRKWKIQKTSLAQELSVAKHPPSFSAALLAKSYTCLCLPFTACVVFCITCHSLAQVGVFERTFRNPVCHHTPLIGWVFRHGSRNSSLMLLMLIH